jgi:hypothetical protein
MPRFSRALFVVSVSSWIGTGGDFPRAASRSVRTALTAAAAKNNGKKKYVARMTSKPVSSASARASASV